MNIFIPDIFETTSCYARGRLIGFSRAKVADKITFEEVENILSLNLPHFSLFGYNDYFNLHIIDSEEILIHVKPLNKIGRIEIDDLKKLLKKYWFYLFAVFGDKLTLVDNELKYLLRAIMYYYVPSSYLAYNNMVLAFPDKVDYCEMYDSVKDCEYYDSRKICLEDAEKSIITTDTLYVRGVFLYDDTNMFDSELSIIGGFDTGIFTNNTKINGIKKIYTAIGTDDFDALKEFFPDLEVYEKVIDR
jgi:hypothetical protein